MPNLMNDKSTSSDKRRKDDDIRSMYKHRILALQKQNIHTPEIVKIVWKEYFPFNKADNNNHTQAGFEPETPG